MTYFQFLCLLLCVCGVFLLSIVQIYFWYDLVEMWKQLHLHIEILNAVMESQSQSI